MSVFGPGQTEGSISIRHVDDSIAFPAAWTSLAATPLNEIRRRARAIEVLEHITPTVVAGAERYAWNDGAGQCTVWYFLPDGRALLLTYDHECALNVYSLPDDYRIQRSFYDGLPPELLALVTDQPENYETLNCTNGGHGKTVFSAGGVFWYDGSAWQPAAGLVDYCRTTGIADMFAEAGFTYCTGPYMFGADFTPETIVARNVEDGHYETDADAAAARAEIAATMAAIT